MTTAPLHIRPTDAWANDRRVKYAYLAHVAQAIMNRASDEDHQYDALAALIGDCYPNATTNN